MALRNSFVHHVFFWLKNPDSTQDRNSLVQGLKDLSAAPIIRDFHIGIPADTHREVVERSYSVSWLILFDKPEDQEDYQVAPIHQEFVKKCSHLWNKVVVYDSIAT